MFVTYVYKLTTINIPDIKPPLSNIQFELLKLFAANVSDDDLRIIKKMIAGYLLEKARDRADAIWEERGYTDEKLQTILNEG